MMLNDKARWKMLQALAHDLCAAAHEDFQMGCTGWMSLDGEFLVSCATHKMLAMEIYKAAVEKEENSEYPENS